MTTTAERVPTKYLSCSETAKLLRAALSAEFGETFPDVKFSVQSKSYAGGASINIYWQDGPTEKKVDAIAQKFSGADFDGMQDMKTYREDTIIGGVPVHFGADYIFTNRSYGRELLEGVAEFVAADWGCTVPAVEESAWSPGHWNFVRTFDTENYRTVSETANDYARRAYFEEVEEVGPVLMLEEK